MTVLWRVVERPADVELSGLLRLRVVGADPEQVQKTTQNLHDQAAVWTGSRHVSRLHDGRSVLMTFRITLASGPTPADLRGLADVASGVGSRGRQFIGPPEAVTAAFGVTQWAERAQRRERAINVVVAGTGPEDSVTHAACAIFYSVRHIFADSRPGSFYLAHEIGHLIGLDEAYGSTRVAESCGSRCIGNIMRNTNAIWFRATPGGGDPTAGRYIRRPWVGRPQTRELAEMAVFAGRQHGDWGWRSTPPEAQRFYWLSRSGRRINTHQCSSYRDERPRQSWF